MVEVKLMFLYALRRDLVSDPATINAQPLANAFLYALRRDLISDPIASDGVVTSIDAYWLRGPPPEGFRMAPKTTIENSVLAEARQRIDQIIAPETDSVYVFRQCAACWDTVGIHGQATADDEPLCWSIF